MIKFMTWMKENYLNLFIFFHQSHKIKVFGMAMGVSEVASSPLTAWKNRCVICGDEFIVLTGSGIRQLDEGYKYCDVVRWMGSE